MLAIHNNKVKLGIQYCGVDFKKYMNQNLNLSYRDMKILFYNLIKAFYILKVNNVVHNDVSPNNILIESPEKIKIIDFENSFTNAKKYTENNFPVYTPSSRASGLYVSPELMTYRRRIFDDMKFIMYDPYKSEVFSLGLCFLYVCGIEINSLNLFGPNYDIHIKEMLVISYDYIAKDSLRKVSYKKLREELQVAIDKKIEENPYDFFNDILRRMLEVDMVERATIEEVYRDAKFNVGIFD